VFAAICKILPFESCLNIVRGIMKGNLDIILPRNIIVFLIYTLGVLVLSIIAFKKKMFSDNK